MPDHPTQSDIQEWIHGKLTAKDVTWIESHLERCAECGTILEELLRDQENSAWDIGKVLQTEGDRHGTFPQEISSSSALEKPGTQIGRYKILQPIGQGGMGSVWMAEQLEPVRRKVAFKIIKAGMDTKEVLARFEVERQALAMMDHPNIARVLDGGAADNGRPYFVMELVKGISITDYCDRFWLGEGDWPTAYPGNDVHRDRSNGRHTGLHES